MSEIKATWVGPGLRLLGEANGGPVVVMDSGHPPYGTQTGASPMELVLIGLALLVAYVPWLTLFIPNLLK